MSNLTFLILSLLVLILLVYNLIILIRRKEYESGRILKSYNTLIFGVFILTLGFFVKFFKFLVIELGDYLGFLIDFMGLFDLISNVFLLTLFAVSFLVGVFVLREI